MAEKGYVSVPEDQMAAKQQELTAIAAEKARREAAATLPQSPSGATSHQASVKPKTQPKPSQPAVSAN